jgi:tetratricopeptide (TPR) repeat protein
LMDFELAGSGGKVTFLDWSPSATPALSPAAYLKQGLHVEANDEPAAIAAYRRAIEMDPAFADAYLGLGAMLCEARQCGAAVVLSNSAVGACPAAALIRFNRAVALEDLGRFDGAEVDYEIGLLLDASLADAHSTSRG